MREKGRRVRYCKVKFRVQNLRKEGPNEAYMLMLQLWRFALSVLLYVPVDGDCFSVLHHDILSVRRSICFQVQLFPNYVEQSEVEASKDGRVLTDFYYGCAGYSLYSIKDHSTDKQVSKKELPVCVGLELLVDRRVATADSASAPAHIHRKEDGRELPQPQPSRELPQPRAQKPASSPADDFFSRYMRNSGLVASGVARNMRRVGIYIKDSVDDMLFPYGRRPK
ncbi:ALTERED INHERITANCE OF MITOCHONDRIA PROTEIN [Salix koriyanagi]|uniref:ALTERED INHERITANCE OF MITOCHONDRIA PROTEIN n=1 Tax=Salix koriyanagi TaxID=2511006 RepID=A0A9Q0UN17_9ROSI|nr:ALTERED INHERITANCE OF MITOCHONDRIA PROTEIN [Salix koriyanagi]